MRRAVFYPRDSTQDQTTANQERELRAVGERMGYAVVKVYKEHGIRTATSGRHSMPSARTPRGVSSMSLWGLRCYGAGGRRGLWHSRRSVQQHQWSAPCRNLLMRAGPSPPSSRIALSSP
jgi:hypothetical protein